VDDARSEGWNRNLSLREPRDTIRLHLETTLQQLQERQSRPAWIQKGHRITRLRPPSHPDTPLLLLSQVVLMGNTGTTTGATGTAANGRGGSSWMEEERESRQQDIDQSRKELNKAL